MRPSARTPACPRSRLPSATIRRACRSLRARGHNAAPPSRRRHRPATWLQCSPAGTLGRLCGRSILASAPLGTLFGRPLLTSSSLGAARTTAIRAIMPSLYFPQRRSHPHLCALWKDDRRVKLHGPEQVSISQRATHAKARNPKASLSNLGQKAAEAGAAARSRIRGAWPQRISIDDAVVMASDSPLERFQKPQGFSVSLSIADPAESLRSADARCPIRNSRASHPQCPPLSRWPAALSVAQTSTEVCLLQYSLELKSGFELRGAAQAKGSCSSRSHEA